MPIEEINLGDAPQPVVQSKVTEVNLGDVPKPTEVPITDPFEKRVGDFYKLIQDTSDLERKTVLSTAWMGNLFGINAFLSRHGVSIKRPDWFPKSEKLYQKVPHPFLMGALESEKGDTGAFYEAIKRYSNDQALNSPDKWAAMAGDIGKTVTEFALIPEVKAAKYIANGLRFGIQTALQAPTVEEENQPLLTSLENRALNVGQSFLTGAVLGKFGQVIDPLAGKIASKFGVSSNFGKALIKTAIEAPPVAGGFMALTAVQGGSREQVLETGIQILGFEALGLAQAGLFSKATEKATEFNPKLAEEAPPGELQKVISNLATTIADTHNRTGGSTISPKTGEPIKTGFAVSINKSFEKILPTDKITKEDITTYKNEHKDFFKENPDAVIGTWVDNGKTYLDVSRVVSTQEEAFNVGKANSQLTVFDLSKFQTIPIPEDYTPTNIYKGKAYRFETGTETHPDAKTAADVIRYEQDELGNTDLGVSPEKLKELEKRPATDIVWVTRDKVEAARYGTERNNIDEPPSAKDIEGVSDYTDVVKGGEIVSEIGEDGVLVLKPVGEVTTINNINEKYTPTYNGMTKEEFTSRPGIESYPKNMPLNSTEKRSLDGTSLYENGKVKKLTRGEVFDRMVSQKGYVPTGTQPEPKIENINDKLTAQLDYVKDLRQIVAAPALKELRAKQATEYKNILEDELAKGTPPEEAQTKALAGMKEVANIPEITPPELSDAEWNTLFTKNSEVHKDAFDIVNTRKALVDWRNGKILQDSQFKYLADVVGNKVATELYYKIKSLTPLNVWDYLRASFQFFKLPFAYDVQFFRQASSFAARHPIRYFKSGVEALRAYVSEGFAERVQANTKADPLHQDAIDHNVPFLSEAAWSTVAGKELAPEQFAMGRPFVQKALKYGLKGTKAQRILSAPIRGIAKWYLASERSMIVSCNSFMQGLWDTQINQWNKGVERGEITPEKLETYKTNYADTLGTFMKLLRAKTKSGAAIQQAANYFLFSPSMTASRFKRPYVMLANGGSRVYAASLVATEIGKIFLVSALVKTIGELYKDKDGKPSMESSYDPTSTMWGTVKVGNAHYDFGGGDIQYYRTIARFVTGEMRNQAGVIKEVPRLSILEQYVKSRETAIIGVMVEIATGRNFNGDKIWETPNWETFPQEHTGVAAKTVAKVGEYMTPSPVDKAIFLGARELAKATAPQFLGDVFNAAIDGGWGTMLSTQVSDTLSMNVQIYPESASIQQQKKQLEVAQIEYQKNWDELGPRQQAQLERKYPVINDLKQQAKFERSEKDQEIAIKPKQLPLSSESKGVFKKYNVPYPAVARNVGSQFYLNNDRFELYQQMATQAIDDRIKFITTSPGWKNLTAEKRQERIIQEVELVKGNVRNQLLRQIKIESTVR